MNRATITSALNLKPSSYKWIKSKVRMTKSGLKTQSHDRGAGVDKLHTNGGSLMAILKATRNLETNPDIMEPPQKLISRSWAKFYNHKLFLTNFQNITSGNWTRPSNILRSQVNRGRKALAPRKFPVIHLIRISHLASVNNTVATQTWRKDWNRSNARIRV